MRRRRPGPSQSRGQGPRSARQSHGWNAPRGRALGPGPGPVAGLLRAPPWASPQPGPLPEDAQAQLWGPRRLWGSLIQAGVAAGSPSNPGWRSWARGRERLAQPGAQGLHSEMDPRPLPRSRGNLAEWGGEYVFGGAQPAHPTLMEQLQGGSDRPGTPTP